MTARFSRRSLIATSLLSAASWATLPVSRSAAQPPQWVRVAGPVGSEVIQFRSEAGQPVVITAIAFDSKSNALAVAGDDDRIRIVNSTTLQTIKNLTGHRDRIRTLDFDSSGNRLISAGNDGQLIVWDAAGDYSMRQRLSGTPALAKIRFSPDQTQIAAVGFDNEVFLIGQRGSRKPPLNCDCTDLRAVAYRDDGQMIAVAGRTGELHLFDNVTSQPISEHATHEGRIHDLVFAPKSRWVLSVGEDGEVIVFDTATAKLIHKIPVTSGKLFAVEVIDDQTIAVAGSDNVVRVVNFVEGRVVRSLEGHRGSVPTLAASGGYLFSGGFDATIRRWAIDEIRFGDERIAETDLPDQR